MIRFSSGGYVDIWLIRRTLQAGGTEGGYESFADLALVYGASAIIPFYGALLHNVFVRRIAHKTPQLVIPLFGERQRRVE